MPAFRLGVAFPLFLAAVCLADGITRAMPVTTWTFRAWEGVFVHHQPTTPFEPLARFESTRSFGDLANMGNLPWMRVHRHETFTVDAYGFRNRVDRVDRGAVDVLLLGDSFTAGSGVGDEMTLAAQLTSAWGLGTYTTAPMLLRAPAIERFASLLGMRPGGWVVHQQTYTYGEAQAWDISPQRHAATTPAQRFAQSFRADLSPLGILVNQAWKRAQDDVWLPNPFRAAVQRARLETGDDLLFIAGESSTPGVAPDTAREIAGSVAYAQSLHEAANRLGLHYLLVLMPVKTAVYQHLMTMPAGDPVPPGIVVETERQAREAGVDVLNLFPALAERASRLAPRHQLVFWRDDTHWSPAGIATAAEAIAAVIAEARRDGR